MNDNGALLLDSNSLYARSWFAATAAGDTQLTKQFMLKTLLELLTDSSSTGGLTTHALACWDGKAKNDKGRVPKPSGYHEMMDSCMDSITTLIGIPQCRLQTEAEDQVATAAYSCCQDPSFKRIVVVSGDKDLKQVAGLMGKVRYYCLNKKDLQSERAICAKYGVKNPSQIGLVLAILGDQVDNISGIPGWGPAKVKKLFQDIQSDDDLGLVAEKIITKIPAHLQEGFLRDMELTVLDTGIPGVPAPGPVSIASAETFYELGLTSLAYYAM